MFKRAWADYEENEELPPIPLNLLKEHCLNKTVKPTIKPTNNKFCVLDLDDSESDTESDLDTVDFCMGCETGADAECAHTCCI